MSWPVTPMQCANCNAQNPDDAKFCLECGAALTRKCSRCGAQNPPGAKFCGECGLRLPTAASASPSALPGDARSPSGSATSSSDDGAGGVHNGTPASIWRGPAYRRDSPPHSPHRISMTVPNAVNITAGERKTLTALFADIKGSTELMEDIDPEEAQALIDPALRLMIEAVQHFDGYIVQSTGDGVFAVFGAPIAHEDHPQRALYAALRMQDQLRDYGARLRAEVDRHGNPRWRQHRRSRRALDSDRRAQRRIHSHRLHHQSRRTPANHRLHRLDRHQQEYRAYYRYRYFVLKPLGPVKIRGISDPVEVFEVGGLGPLRTRLQASAMRGLSKFVGRAREIAKLTEAFELAQRGHGQIVAAVADAGVGKSRLFHEFKAIAGAGALMLDAYSVSHGKASAYLPVIELLNDYFAIAPGDDRRRRREKVGGKILMLDRALEDTLPFLIALLGLRGRRRRCRKSERQSADWPGRAHAPAPHAQGHQACSCAKASTSRSSSFSGHIHWVDSATQVLLDLMAEGVGAARLLMLVNYRPD